MTSRFTKRLHNHNHVTDNKRQNALSNSDTYKMSNKVIFYKKLLTGKLKKIAVLNKRFQNYPNRWKIEDTNELKLEIKLERSIKLFMSNHEKIDNVIKPWSKQITEQEWVQTWGPSCLFGVYLLSPSSISGSTNAAKLDSSEGKPRTLHDTSAKVSFLQTMMKTRY